MSRLHVRIVYARCLLAFVALTFVSQVLADNPGHFKSACEYQGDSGKYRWAAKIDPASPPSSVDSAHRLTPLKLYNWTGGRGNILSKTPRQGRETEWLQLTGKVTAVIVEGDGDIHVELINASGNSQVKAGRRNSGGAALVSDSKSHIRLDQGKISNFNGPERADSGETSSHHRYWKSVLGWPTLSKGN